MTWSHRHRASDQDTGPMDRRVIMGPSRSVWEKFIRRADGVTRAWKTTVRLRIPALAPAGLAAVAIVLAAPHFGITPVPASPSSSPDFHPLVPLICSFPLQLTPNPPLVHPRQNSSRCWVLFCLFLFVFNCREQKRG